MNGVMTGVRWVFGSEKAAATLAHKALWTSVQSALGVLLADGMLDLGIAGPETVAVAAVSGALVVLKEFARKQLNASAEG